MVVLDSRRAEGQGQKTPLRVRFKYKQPQAYDQNQMNRPTVARMFLMKLYFQMNFQEELLVKSKNNTEIPTPLETNTQTNTPMTQLASQGRGNTYDRPRGQQAYPSLLPFHTSVKSNMIRNLCETPLH